MDFETIYRQVMKKCHHDPDTETDLVEDVKEWINNRYHRIWGALLGGDPTFGRATAVLAYVALYNTGSVTTDGTATITGDGTTFTSAMVGRKFSLVSWAEVYRVAAFVSATEITLDSVINAPDNSDVGYTIYDDEISLLSDCGEIVYLGQRASSTDLIKKGLAEIRSKQVESPFTSTEIQYNDPKYYAYLSDSTIVVYPAPSRAIRIDLDYTKKFTELSDDWDEPLIPIDFHELLIIGGRADLLDYDDDIRADRKEAEFERMFRMLQMKYAAKTDLLQIKPFVRRT